MENHYIENIKSLRKSKGLSQKDMGECLGIAASNYNTIENGLAEITVSRLYKIAEILEVSVSQILYGNDFNKLNDDVKKEIDSIQVSDVYNTIKSKIIEEAEIEIGREFRGIFVNIKNILEVSHLPERLGRIVERELKIFTDNAFEGFKNPIPETPEKKAEREKRNEDGVNERLKNMAENENKPRKRFTEEDK